VVGADWVHRGIPPVGPSDLPDRSDVGRQSD
jgi:hypothetical protein